MQYTVITVTVLQYFELCCEVLLILVAYCTVAITVPVYIFYTQKLQEGQTFQSKKYRLNIRS